MESESRQTTSPWIATVDMPAYPPLSEDVRADVCIIGAGIAGMTTAYLLAKAGRKVVVLDDGLIGNGETGRTTAHVTAALDDRYFRIESMHGSDGARLAAESHMAAVNRATFIMREEEIDCDFEIVDGYLFAPEGMTQVEFRRRLERELPAVHRAGIADAVVVERCPFDFWDSGIALKFPDQVQFHPLKFLAGLARCIERDGGRIFNNTHVEGIEGGTPTLTRTDKGFRVTAGAAVVCTNASISDYVVTHTKQAAYRTYVIAARVPTGSVPRGLYWDDADPYHYVRLQRVQDGDLLIVGGEDHKTGHTDGRRRFAALEDWTRKRFPMTGPIAYRWSGQVLEPFDYLAFTGPNPDGAENVFMHSGDSGNGITHGIVAGILLNDLVEKRDNPWAKIYDPKRVSLKATPEFIKENADVAAHYTEYLKSGDVSGADEIPLGEGRITVRGGKQIAAYRDTSGVLHECSAVCTHLKCLVHWNTTEKTWDCPCHGSRFDPYGKVLNGPAISPLEKL